MAPAVAATAGRDHIVQDGKVLLRPHPAFYVNFFGANPVRGILQCIMLTSANAKFTLSMGRNLNSDRRRSQVSDLAEKSNRTLTIAVFHLSIRRTHPTQRLNAALDGTLSLVYVFVFGPRAENAPIPV